MSEQLKLIPDSKLEPYNAQVGLNALPDTFPGPPPSEAFVAHLRTVGLLHPVVLMEKGHGQYVVVAGRQRIQAARLLGWDTIPARVYAEGYVNPEMITLAENALRRKNVPADLNAVRSMWARGATDEQIKEHGGLSGNYYKRLLRLLRMNEEIRQAYEDGKIRLGVAEAVSKLSREDQEQLAAVLHEQGKLTHEDLKALRQSRSAETAGSLPSSLFKMDDLRKDEEPERPWHERVMDLLEKSLASVPEEKGAKKVLTAIQKALKECLSCRPAPTENGESDGE